MHVTAVRGAETARARRRNRANIVRAPLGMRNASWFGMNGLSTKPGSLYGVIGEVSPPDRLALAALMMLAAICAVTQTRPAPLLAMMGAVAIAIVAIALWGARSSAGRLAHDFFPILFIVIFFELAGPVIAVANPTRWDATFEAIDTRWFEGLADAWRGALGRPAWLTDAAYLAYVSFYFVPTALAVALYRRPNRAPFDAYVLAVLSTFAASWLGYLVFPALGPRVPQELEQLVLGGTWISQGIRVMLRRMEGNVLDAFPSGHTAVSLVYIGYGWKHFPRWRALLLAGEVLLLFSTVYLSLHYVVDLVGGALLAGATVGVLRLYVAAAAPSFQGAEAKRTPR